LAIPSTENWQTAIYFCKNILPCDTITFVATIPTWQNIMRQEYGCRFWLSYAAASMLSIPLFYCGFLKAIANIYQYGLAL
jgi:hypothetical protein